MSQENTLDNARNEKVSVRHKVVVEHVGEKLIIPTTMSLQQARQAIDEKIAYDAEVIAIDAIIEAPFLYEAAYALNAVLKEKYGWANMIPTEGFFGDSPPKMLSVPIGRNESISVPWGAFKLPGIAGHLETAKAMGKDGHAVLRITGAVYRRDEDTINGIIEAVRRNVREHSIYKGKAFRVRLTDDHGEPLEMPTPEFLDLDPTVERDLVLPASTALSVRAHIDTIIERTAEVRDRLKTQLKRGILLAGPYGTGKTMVAHRTALKAIRNGWTYIVVDKPQELAQVLRLAREYGPVVLFCEDIDRIMSGDRSIGMDEVLNIVDGVESKGSEMMVVFTTNELSSINQAMLRPGRLDAVIPVTAPDADAAERLARQYGRGLIAEDAPLTKSKVALAGKIPAVIREVTERAKLYALAASEPGASLAIDDDALLAAVTEMSDHIDLLTPKPEDTRSSTEKAADTLATAMRETGVAPIFPIRDDHDVAAEHLASRSK